VTAAAAMIGAGPHVAARDLEELHADHLLEETGPDRYRLHDLIRVYATRLAQDFSATATRPRSGCWSTT
jgi:hypothetical protein